MLTYRIQYETKKGSRFHLAVSLYWVGGCEGLMTVTYKADINVLLCAINLSYLVLGSLQAGGQDWKAPQFRQRHLSPTFFYATIHNTLFIITDIYFF